MKNGVRNEISLAKTVVLSCRILAKLGLFKETTGHVSARVTDDKMLIRGRGPDETGLLFTKPSDVILTDLQGRILKKRTGLKPPNEACIHGEVYRTKPLAAGVVHAHPPSVVLCSMAGIELRPIFGGYDPNSMRLLLKGIPIYPRTLTLNSKEQVEEMLQVMGDSDICILKGHGIVVAGNSVEQATVTAIKLDTLARMNLHAASLGTVPSIPDEDIAEFRQRTGKGNSSVEGLWRYYCQWLKNG